MDNLSAIIIGAGPAGLSAAIHASQFGAKVLVLEKNEKAGKKLFITGKGRCNVCNDCTPQEFIANVMRNPHFLHSAFANFSAQDAMAFFEGEGVPLEVERGKRVFPRSHKAYDITDALVHKAMKQGVSFHFEEPVLRIEDSPEGFLVRTARREYRANHVVIATGGLAYPSTGSTGDGHRFATAFGHAVTSLRPGLVGLKISDPIPSNLENLTLKNVALSYQDGKKRKTEFGELTFRRGFLDGPIALTVSSRLSNLESPSLSLDLKPALSLEQLDARLEREIQKDRKQTLHNLLSSLLPQDFIPFFASISKIDLSRTVSDFRKEERLALAKALKGLPLHFAGLNPFERAVITVGGVSVKEISSSTMESKLIPGLYFAGEVLDVDALTGGFNIQIALSTGALAGDAIAAE